MSNTINSNKSLFILCETSQTKKDELKKAFDNFGDRHGVDVSSIISLIEKHDKFITNGEYYFKYNSRLPFLQKFRSNREQVLKLNEFYKTFAPIGEVNKPKKHNCTWFWTITRKTFDLDKLEIELKERKGRHGETSIRTKIKFKEIELADNNLNALFKRLERYGYKLNKYILVPEIKDSKDGKFNYHYHMICEPEVDVAKIRTNSRIEMRDLVYDDRLGVHREDGFINNSVLSTIWKEITKDGSYRILPEEIKSRQGVFHYVLSYLNKPMEYRNPEKVPYMYYALKSKKSYRVKGKNKKFPEIKYQILDEKKNPIKFEYHQIEFVNPEEIKRDFQIYYIQLFKDGHLVEEIRKTDFFNSDIKSVDHINRLLFSFDEKLRRSRHIFKTKNNWAEVENVFSDKEIQKMLLEGDIFETKKGYALL